MACLTVLKGIEADCLNNIGGIKKIMLAPWGAVSEEDITVGEDGVITRVDVEAFKLFYTKKNSSSMTSTYNIDPTNGITYVSTELQLTFARMDATKRMEINALATGDLRAIVVDSNNTAYYLGFDEPVTLTAATAQTGQAKSDGNFYQVTLTDESLELPHLINTGVVD